ncbi:MAG: hypothetical protein JXC32_12295, partial [Anaerolineae bacterium]|nr:hypothetical protein [Anaerolineae bacterium]
TADGYLPASPDWLPPDTAAGAVDPEQAQGDLVLRPLPVDATYMPYVRLEIPGGSVTELDGVGDEDVVSLQLVTRLWGVTQTVTQPVLSAYPLPAVGPLPAAPPLEEALAQHPMLRTGDAAERMLTIPAGEWTVTSSLVLPEGYGLVLEPGTALHFASDAFLLARGPLLFQGTEADPIHLGPLDGTWSGVITLGSERASYWDYVTVADTSAVALPGWTLTGAITFYESDIALNHVRLLGTTAEDAINVIRSTFVFENSVFADTFSDAFDADFSQGEVTACGFNNIGADAIDTSGSEVHVRDVRMVGLGDKALSAGEASRVSAEAITVDGADYGIVSKDLSHVTVQGGTIRGTRVAALAAYIKKPSYGPATMTARALVFEGVGEDAITLVQTGSWIDLDGERVWGVDVDVDALYTD